MEELALKYKRPDVSGGYLTDKNEIEYYKTVQYNDVIDNIMLGDYDKEGNYIVEKGIIRELIDLRKIYIESYDKSILCDSAKMFDGKVLHFCLNILKNIPEKGKVTATLSLLEDIQRVNGYYKNTNTAVLVTHVFDDDANINDKILKLFNISSSNGDDDGAEKIETDYDFPNINKRLNYFRDLNKYYVSVGARNQKRLYERRIKILLKSKSANIILEELNKQAFHIKGKFLDKNSAQYFKHLNQLLDSVLETHGHTIAHDKKLLADLAHAQMEFCGRHQKDHLVISNNVLNGNKFNQEVIVAPLPKTEAPKVEAPKIKEEKVIAPKTELPKNKQETIKDSKSHEIKIKKGEKEVSKPVKDKVNLDAIEKKLAVGVAGASLEDNLKSMEEETL